MSLSSRLFKHDPATNTTSVLLSGINFANGLALNARETALLVSETARFRVRRSVSPSLSLLSVFLSPINSNHLVYDVKSCLCAKRCDKFAVGILLPDSVTAPTRHSELSRGFAPAPCPQSVAEG